MSYIGINNPILVVDSKVEVDWNAKNISIEGVIFDEKYQNIVKSNINNFSCATEKNELVLVNGLNEEFNDKETIEDAKSFFKEKIKDIKQGFEDILEEKKEEKVEVKKSWFKEKVEDLKQEFGDMVEEKGEEKVEIKKSWFKEKVEDLKEKFDDMLEE